MRHQHGCKALLGVAVALALPASASADVTVGADNFKFVPIIKKVIPVLHNDSGDGLRIVGHTAAGHGSVDCDATTCTYTPPARAFPPDDADGDGIVAPDQDDSFSYTVADSTDQQGTGLVTLTAVKPVAHVHPGKVGSSSRCTRSTKPRKPDPPRRPSDTPGEGGAITYALAVCTHKKPASNTPPYHPEVNVPAVGLAVAALRASQITGGWSARCTWTGGGFGFGGFNIHEWIGENGSTGVNRFTIRFRQQVYGENGFGTRGWSTLESTDWAANNSNNLPDSANSWFPANRDHYWVYGWGKGDETLVEGYEAFRMQVRVQWIHRRHAPLADKKVIDPGWYTRCSGRPHVSQ